MAPERKVVTESTVASEEGKSSGSNPEEETLTKSEAFKELRREFGVDEQATLKLFCEHNLADVKRFQNESPIKNALVMWTKHQFERDAIIIAEALEDHGQRVNRMLIEVICTRSPKAVTGAKSVFQDMYGYRMERKLQKCNPQTLEHRTLRVLLGGIKPIKRTKDEKKDLMMLFLAMKNGDMITTVATENETDGDEINKNSPGKETKLRSMWNEGGTNKIEKLIGDEYPRDVSYENVINILKTHRDPMTYFLTTLNLAFETKNEAHLTRVLVTRAFVDLGNIKKTYLEAHGLPLDQKIENATSGCYKEFIKHVMANAVDMCYI
ncbi:hypothetical protein L2E82_11273 [Cichorium intybus]|uniref:Uncharacterized protein n=1 Tax=Cichorium intybus TaxID=13427 RepID=A0ACB9GCV0_CICIN|nr:hypothetical protein L2E82_11273 [Cichorium intybus]